MRRCHSGVKSPVCRADLATTWKAGIRMNIGALSRQERTFDAVPASARAARAFVAEILGQGGADAAVIGDYQLAVGELATNVIEHGDGSSLTISVDLADARWWDVEVIGCAPPPGNRVLEPDAWEVARPAQTSGRGLGIVRQLMDEVVTAVADGRLGIRCRRRRL